MLAQNFKSHTDLGLTEPQFDALRKTLVLLETEKLALVVPKENDCQMHGRVGAFEGKFNMDQWNRVYEHCGTVCCIGGTAELIGEVSFGSEHTKLPNTLYNLFYPNTIEGEWGFITPTQAAAALRSFLTTGDARWDLAVVS